MLHSPRGSEIRKQFDANRVCCDLSVAAGPLADRGRRRSAAVRRIPSEIGQDKWVLVKMFPEVTNGVFLDVGSGHGTIGSNTKALEERGWTGICVDPFPTHMEGRTCQMVKEVVSSVSGQMVKFHTHAGLGGIADTLGKWKEEASKSPAVELTTVTLARDSRARQGAVVHSLPEPGHRRRRARRATRHAARQVSIRRDGHRTQRGRAEADRHPEVSRGTRLPPGHTFIQAG